MRCEWAACRELSAGVVAGFEMCHPHRAEHYAQRREEQAERKRPAPPAPRKPSKAAAKLAARPRPRSDAGKRRDVDSPVNRCRTCGEWRYGRQACAACGTAVVVSLDEAPRRPNIGRRSA